MYKDKIQAFFSEEEPESKEIFAQAPAKVVTKSAPVMEKEKVAVPEPVKLKPVTEEEEVPFEPLPQMQLSKKDEDPVEEQIAQNKLPDPKKMVVADYNKDPFGLVCTKFSRLPSRFRMAS